MADRTNAQVALEAAALVHGKVAAGAGAGGGSYSSGSVRVDLSSDRAVLSTANSFLEWLRRNS